MKKTYITPATDVVAIQTAGMLAQSLPVSSTEQIESENEFLSPELMIDLMIK